MERNDSAVLTDRLTELAEALGGKAPSPKALNVWLDALKECGREEVLAVLTDWPKSHAKMPVPSEILKACREQLSTRIERDAVKRAQESSKALSGVYQPQGRSEVGKAALVEIKAILADSTPGYVAGNFQHVGGNSSIDPKGWARVLRVREAAGEPLSIMQRQAWRAALGVDAKAAAE